MERPLPPLNAVRAFEVAARWLNFSRAAEEMGVSHGAVSKQIKILEDYIGAQLFDRRPEGLALTQEGRMLRDSIEPAFENLRTAFARYSRRSPRSRRFRLATTASFASHFLAPRMDDFNAMLPDIDLEILTSDRVVDFDKEDVDLSIRFGAGNWDGLVSEKASPGTLVPVCAPDLLKKTGGGPAGLITSVERRIQIFSNNEWRAWSKAANLDLTNAPPPFMLEHFVVAIEAVLSGQGYALLPRILASRHLDDGSMTIFSDVYIDWPQAFYVVHPRRNENQTAMKNIIAWIKKAAAQASGYER